MQIIESYPVAFLWALPGFIAFVWEHSVPKLFKSCYAESYQRYLNHPLLPHYVPWPLMQFGLIIVSLIVTLISGPFGLMHIIQETTWLFIRTWVRWAVAVVFLLVAMVATAQVVEFSNGRYKGVIELDTGDTLQVMDTDIHQFADLWFVDVQKKTNSLSIYGFKKDTGEPVWIHNFHGEKEEEVTYHDGYRCLTWTDSKLSICAVIFEYPRLVNGRLRYVIEAVWLGNPDSRTLLSNITLENTEPGR